MRILHVTAVMASSYGGPKVVVETLAEAQVSLGHEVTVAATDCGYPKGRLTAEERRVLERGRVTYQFFPGSRLLLYLSISMWKWLTGRVGQFDVVHIHGLYRLPQAMGAILAGRHGIPHLITPHGALDPFLYRTSRTNRLLKRIYDVVVERRLLRAADAIHFTEEEEARIAVLPDNIRRKIVVPNGLDLERFEHLPRRGSFRDRRYGAGEYLITFYGRVNFKKGLDLLIPAFAEVLARAPACRLLIVGPDNDGYLSTVEQWIDEHGIGSHVDCLGSVSRGDGIGILRDSDLFVLPSHSENFGMTVLEALLCECPVVISKAVNVQERLGAVNAAVITGLTIQEVAEGMLRMIEDPQFAAASARRGRAYVRESLSIDTVAREMVDHYEALA